MIRHISLLIIPVLVFSSSGNAGAQIRKSAPVCSQTTMAAHKDLPELQYDCPEGLIESDDRILTLPARLIALNEVLTVLADFENPAWWQAGVDDLTACEFHRVVGDFSDEHIEAWKRNLSFQSLRQSSDSTRAD